MIVVADPLELADHVARGVDDVERGARDRGAGEVALGVAVGDADPALPEGAERALELAVHRGVDVGVGRAGRHVDEAVEVDHVLDPEDRGQVVGAVFDRVVRRDTGRQEEGEPEGTVHGRAPSQAPIRAEPRDLPSRSLPIATSDLRSRQVVSPG